MRHTNFQPINRFEPAPTSAGLLSAAPTPRADTPAPLRPLGGAGTPSLLAAAIRDRTLHPLVEEVHLGGPRVHHMHACAMPPRISRRNRVAVAVLSVGGVLCEAVGIAILVGGLTGLLALAALRDAGSPITLQAEARP